MWIEQTDYEWIDAVCRQLSRVTGWPTSFAPHDEVTPDPPGEYHWSCELHTPEGCPGTLHVTLPPGRELDEGFLRACETVDLAMLLIRRVLMARTSPDERSGGPAGPPGSSAGARPTDPWTEAVRRVLDVALRLTSFRAAAVLVLDRDAHRLRLRGQVSRDGMILFGRQLDQSPFDADALRNQLVVIRRRDQRFLEWLPEGMSLGVCRGIQTAQGPQGTLWMFDRRDRRITGREEVVLQSVAARLSELIEQATQIEDGEQQRRLRAELRIAAEAQPQQQLLMQGADGWCRIAARSESAREVGGDLCEVIPLDSERMLLAIGDAAGHSIPAAMVMAAVRGALRVLVDPQHADTLQPHRIVTHLNRVLHGIVESHQFMTLTCAILDARKRTVRLCNAGHPPALLIRGGVAESIDAHGLLLGVVEDAKYRSHTFRLRPGDLLAFYSDGISEARARSQKLFRAESIASIILRHASLPPEQIVETVWTAVQSHVSTAHPDDRTLLIARFEGRPAAARRTSPLPAIPAGV
jgi:phosphoserine phosphatase RsbU/P